MAQNDMFGGMSGLMQMMGPALIGAGVAKKSPGMAAAGFLPLLMQTPGFMNMLKGMGGQGQNAGQGVGQGPTNGMPGGQGFNAMNMFEQMQPPMTGLSPYQGQNSPYEQQEFMPNYSMWGKY